MKKVLAGILAILLALSLCACGETNAIPSDEQTPLFTQAENTTAASAETTVTDTVATEADTIATETTFEATTESTAPAHVHSYTGATCTSPAACSCGATQGSPNGHNFTDGSCVSCGMADPDYQQTINVWIPTNGGKKYHKNASCSNMKDPEAVTQTTAEARGFEPCKKCF